MRLMPRPERPPWRPSRQAPGAANTPAVGQSWRRAWGEVIPFYAFPAEVRRILYSTNAIEALNAKLRRAVRARGHFPTDEAALKLLFLVLNQAEKEWTMPAREWCMARAQFAILFGERFTRASARACATVLSHTKFPTVPDGVLRLHRGLPQSAPTALRPRIPVPDGPRSHHGGTRHRRVIM